MFPQLQWMLGSERLCQVGQRELPIGKTGVPVHREPRAVEASMSSWRGRLGYQRTSGTPSGPAALATFPLWTACAHSAPRQELGTPSGRQGHGWLLYQDHWTGRKTGSSVTWMVGHSLSSPVPPSVMRTGCTSLGPGPQLTASSRHRLEVHRMSLDRGSPKREKWGWAWQCPLKRLKQVCLE